MSSCLDNNSICHSAFVVDIKIDVTLEDPASSVCRCNAKIKTKHIANILHTLIGFNLSDAINDEDSMRGNEYTISRLSAWTSFLKYVQDRNIPLVKSDNNRKQPWLIGPTSYAEQNYVDCHSKPSPWPPVVSWLRWEFVRPAWIIPSCKTEISCLCLRYESTVRPSQHLNISSHITRQPNIFDGYQASFPKRSPVLVAMEIINKHRHGLNPVTMNIRTCLALLKRNIVPVDSEGTL